jgi:hypothetical protein
MNHFNPLKIWRQSYRHNPELLHSFNNDFGINFFPEKTFEAIFYRHCGMRTHAAGTAQANLSGFAGYVNNFQVSAVSLKVDPQFIQPGSDFVMKFRHFNLPVF